MTDNISFEDEHIKITSRPVTGIIGFLINKLGVKNESAANIILVVISLAMLALTAIILKNALV